VSRAANRTRPDSIAVKVSRKGVEALDESIVFGDFRARLAHRLPSAKQGKGDIRAHQVEFGRVGKHREDMMKPRGDELFNGVRGEKRAGEGLEGGFKRSKQLDELVGLSLVLGLGANRILVKSVLFHESIDAFVVVEDATGPYFVLNAMMVHDVSFR